MSTKVTDTREEGAIFGTAEGAEQWQRRAAQRDKVNAKANEMMLDLADLRDGFRVLDVAAGTGEQTLLVARRVGPSGYVLATDLSTSMLNLAAKAIRDAGLTNVETRVMNAEKIDLRRKLIRCGHMPAGPDVLSRPRQSPCGYAACGEAHVKDGCPCMVKCGEKSIPGTSSRDCSAYWKHAIPSSDRWGAVSR